MSELIIHVPHASTFIPEGVAYQFLLEDEALAFEAHESADLYTDLLAQQAWPEATIIAASASRIIVDVERYSDDSMETMSAVGRGMIYSKTHKGRPLRKPVSMLERATLQADHYDSHWQKLRSSSTGKTLIDLHSYPVMQWELEPNAHEPRPENRSGNISRYHTRGVDKSYA